MTHLQLGLAAVTVALLASAGYGLYSQHAKIADTQERLESSVSDATLLEESLAQALNESEALQDALEIERNKNAVFEDQIRSIDTTVAKLDKLSKTDPELLAKYSKVYFLNENYAPAALEIIDPAYQYDSSRELWMHAQVKPHLYALLEAAKKDSIDLKVLSGYRSFDRQADLKGTYTYLYGSGANAFSADQGYSEHQLGTTFDFTTSAVGDTFSGFERTEAYMWLMDNAHRFGFTLSYPANNEHYQYEPWHWRFVSVNLATQLYQDKAYLYDLEQRVISEYLIDFFE